MHKVFRIYGERRNPRGRDVCSQLDASIRLDPVTYKSHGDNLTVTSKFSFCEKESEELYNYTASDFPSIWLLSKPCNYNGAIERGKS